MNMISSQISSSSNVRIKFLQKVCSKSCRITYECAKNGDLLRLEIAISKGCPINDMTSAGAAIIGRIDILQYLYEQYQIIGDEVSTYWTCVHNNIVCLKYLRSIGCPWDTRTTYILAYTKNIDLLRYVLKEGCPYDKGACLFQHPEVDELFAELGL